MLAETGAQQVVNPAVVGATSPLPAEDRVRLGSRGSAVLIGALTLVGVALRVGVADQSLVADELSTYWIITTRGLGGVITTVHSDAEITPPLYFAAAWLTTRLGHTPELVRAPSLLSGAATIPLVYLLGLRTVGRATALLAAALTTFSPFMIYYSAEARGYGLMVALVVLSTVAMLVAVDTSRARWWLIYAIASCAAVYAHYTSVFVLGTQFLWLVWAHPKARTPALLANVGALVAFLPWTTGAINDFSSPTTSILSSFAAGDAHALRVALEDWALGHPSQVPLNQLPGTTALILLVLALAVAVGGVTVVVLRERPHASRGGVDRRLVLVIALALSAPVGEGALACVGPNLLLTRNLAASWPAFALTLSAVIVAAGPRLRFASAAFAVAAFAIGAGKMTNPRFQRPDLQAAADVVDSRASARDVVIDATGELSPGPLTGLDVALHRRHRVFRVGTPQEREEPFVGHVTDRLPFSVVSRRALAAAAGGRILVVGHTFFPVDSRTATSLEHLKPKTSPFPARYRLVETRAYRGLIGVVLSVYADRLSRDRR